MTRDTLALLADLLDQVTLSASAPPDQFEEAARRVAQAKRELADALADADGD